MTKIVEDVFFFELVKMMQWKDLCDVSEYLMIFLHFFTPFVQEIADD